jgi:hypothetical protein
MSRRGLWASSQRPIGIAARAETASASVKAAVSSVVVQPSSFLIGTRKTAKA